MGLVLRRNGRFWHEGVKVTHPGLHRAFLRGVRWAEPESTFVVQVGHFRGWLDVEDIAFWVTGYDPRSGELELSDRSAEKIDPRSLSSDPDEVLRCRVKGRFPARFTRAAQAQLLDSVEIEGVAVCLRIGNRCVRVPGLEQLP